MNDNKPESVSCVASYKVKVFMKLEDPEETYALFEKSVAKKISNEVNEENKPLSSSKED